MGLFDRKRTIETVAPMRGADIAAQIGPAPTLDAFFPFGSADYLASREEAMSVPAIARARNMICNSIATIPLVTRDKSTGQVVDSPVVINDPDKRVPGAASWCWAADLWLARQEAWAHRPSPAPSRQCRTAGISRQGVGLVVLRRAPKKSLVRA